MKNSIFIGTIFLFFFISCSTNQEIVDLGELPKIEKQSGYNLAIERIKQFAETHGSPQTKSINLNGMKILSTEETIYSFEEDFSVDTKLSESESLNVAVYTIAFEKEKKQGFAIATGDERIKDGVYVLTPEGNLSDTSYNIGMKLAIEKIKQVCENDLVNYYSKSKESTKAYWFDPKRIIVNPITNLNWDQTAPFNNLIPYKCPNSNWAYNGNAPTGCTSIACAQAIAYLAPPALETSYSLAALRSAHYSSGYPNFPNQADAIKVARFVLAVGSWVSTIYDCSGSGSHIKRIRTKFDDWGIKYDYSEGNVDLSKLAYNIKKGYPHISRGVDKDKNAGHAWLWEGIDCYQLGEDPTTGQVSFASGERIMLYCNWGWGGTNNGWYVDFERPVNNKGEVISWYVAQSAQLYIKGKAY